MCGVRACVAARLTLAVIMFPVCLVLKMYGIKLMDNNKKTRTHSHTHTRRSLPLLYTKWTPFIGTMSVVSIWCKRHDEQNDIRVRSINVYSILRHTTHPYTRQPGPIITIYIYILSTTSNVYEYSSKGIWILCGAVCTSIVTRYCHAIELSKSHFLSVPQFHGLFN